MSRYDSGQRRRIGSHWHFCRRKYRADKAHKTSRQDQKTIQKTVAVIDWVPAVQQNLHLCYQRTVAAVAARDVTI